MISRCMLVWCSTFSRRVGEVRPSASLGCALEAGRRCPPCASAPHLRLARLKAEVLFAPGHFADPCPVLILKEYNKYRVLFSPKSDLSGDGKPVVVFHHIVTCTVSVYV